MESPLLNLNLDIFRKRAGKNQDLNNCFWGLTLSHRLLKYFDNSTLIFISTEIYDFLAHVLNSWFVLWSVFPEFLWHFLMISHNVAIYTLLTHSSVLAWRIPGTGEPGGLPSLGSHRVGHDWSDLAAAAALPCCFSVTSSSFATPRTVACQALCPWNFLGKNIGVGCHFLLQGIFLIQGSNPGLLHWQADALTSEPPGKPSTIILYT